MIRPTTGNRLDELKELPSWIPATFLIILISEWAMDIAMKYLI
jgi:hypothetical protein